MVNVVYYLRSTRPFAHVAYVPGLGMPRRREAEQQRSGEACADQCQPWEESHGNCPPARACSTQRRGMGGGVLAALKLAALKLNVASVMVVFPQLYSYPLRGSRQGLRPGLPTVDRRENPLIFSTPPRRTRCVRRGLGKRRILPHLPPQGKSKLGSQPLPCRISNGEKSSVRMRPGFHAGALAVFKKDKTSGGILS